MKVLHTSIAVALAIHAAAIGSPHSGIEPIPSHRDATPPTSARLAAFLQERFEGRGVEVYAAGVFVAVRIPAAGYGSGESRMPLAVRRNLDVIREAAAAFVAEFDLLLEGHADASGKTSARSNGTNWNIAYRRAESVRSELVRLGVPEGSIGVLSRGAGLPSGSEVANHRRVEFLFSPKRRVVPDELPAPATESIPDRPAEAAPAEVPPTPAKPRSRDPIAVRISVPMIPLP